MDKLALEPLCQRARTLACHIENNDKRARCLSMIGILEDNPTWPDLKIGGWLEHVVTVCIEAGITTIDEEREFSRPIKHAYYKRIGAVIPPTIDLGENVTQ